MDIPNAFDAIAIKRRSDGTASNIVLTYQKDEETNLVLLKISDTITDIVFDIKYKVLDSDYFYGPLANINANTAMRENSNGEIETFFVAGYTNLATDNRIGSIIASDRTSDCYN